MVDTVLPDVGNADSEGPGVNFIYSFLIFYVPVIQY